MDGLVDRLVKLFKESECTQKELATKVGVTESAMSQYLSGSREPRLRVITNLATALNTTTDYLINGAKDDSLKYEDVYQFATRNAKNFTDEEKIELIKALTK